MDAGLRLPVLEEQHLATCQMSNNPSWRRQTRAKFTGKDETLETICDEVRHRAETKKWQFFGIRNTIQETVMFQDTRPKAAEIVGPYSPWPRRRSARTSMPSAAIGQTFDTLAPVSRKMQGNALA